MAKKERSNIIEAVKNKGKTIEAEMSFFDHLDVLRWHLIRASLAVIVFTVLAWIYFQRIFDGIIMAPKDTNFWTYRMMCKLAEKFSFGDAFCVKEIPFDIINTDMGGQFTLQLNASLMVGVMFGVPYLLYEVWRFVKPGLHEKEAKSATGFVFWASFLFALGVLFGYYIITPLSINFLANYEVSKTIENNITIASYLSTVATLTIGAGIIFELPIIIYILSRLGIMTPAFMRSTRRYAAVIILIVASIVTPTTDLITMLTVSFPLFLLYEISILIAARVEKRKKKEELEFYANKD